MAHSDGSCTPLGTVSRWNKLNALACQIVNGLCKRRDLFVVVFHRHIKDERSELYLPTERLPKQKASNLPIGRHYMQAKLKLFGRVYLRSDRSPTVPPACLPCAVCVHADVTVTLLVCCLPGLAALKLYSSVVISLVSGCNILCTRLHTIQL